MANGGPGFASGVYLGYGWVLTAYHVVQNFSGGFLLGNSVFDGVTYAAEQGSGIRLQNPDTSFTDLALFRLETEPAGLQPLTLATTTPTVADIQSGYDVVMAGFGPNRETTSTRWSVSGSTWAEVPAGGNVRGYKSVAGQTVRWGTNRLELQSGAATQTINIGLGPVTVLQTSFDFFTSGEAQALVGDSGGGLFHKRADNVWELAGILDAIGTLPGQPSQTAVNGNVTLSVNIATYSGQIASIIPEPGSAVAILSGLVLLGLSRRRRR
jgi:hypothetical protein